MQITICKKDTGEVIGDCGVRLLSNDSREVEIGYTIATTYQGKGFAIEAVKAVIDYIFNILHKNRVYTFVDPRNEKSIALLKKIGMKKETHFMKSILLDDTLVDDAVYAILVEEWSMIILNGFCEA
jgi:RimJ/RimL family protein N-acetyltransferase